jgi:hypothetical protein
MTLIISLIKISQLTPGYYWDAHKHDDIAGG